VTRGLKSDLDAGAYDRVVADGRTWLASNAAGASGEKARLADEVARLVAEAELGKARRADSSPELRAFRARYAGDPRHTDLVARARAFNAEVELRKEILPAPSLPRLRAFREEYPGCPEEVRARALELKLAEGIAAEGLTVEAERAFRGAYGRWPEAGPALARSRSRELDRAERVVAATAAAERAFRAEYGAWPEAAPALARSRSRELAAAEPGGGATPAVERAFREAYGKWTEAAAAIARSRAREVEAALAAASGDEERMAAFQVEYLDWPEAAGARTQARSAEAALALAAAAGDLDRLRAFRARFPEPPWPDRADSAMGAVLVEPLRLELAAGQRPSETTLSTLTDPSLPLGPLRSAAAELDAPLWAVAEKTDDGGAWWLHGHLFPGSPRAPEARKRAIAASWREAQRAGTADAYNGFARRYPESAEAVTAEGRATTLLRLSRPDPEAPRAVVTGRRELPSGEVELMLDVLRCGDRVAGLRRDAFELYAGTERRPLTGFLALEEDRPVHFVFAVDLSGSMAAEREAVRTAILEFAETFRFRGRRAGFGLVTFSDEIRDRRAPSERPEDFRSWMSAVGEASGGAVENTLGGLEASSELLAATSGERVVVLLTDEPLQRAMGDPVARARRSGRCGAVLRAREEFQACTSPRCRLASIRGLDPAVATAVDQCVRYLDMRLCDRQVDLGIFTGFLARCSGGQDQFVATSSPAFTALRRRLGAREIRPFLILSEDVAGSPPFVELAAPLNGRTFSVDDDSADPATFTAPLLAIADQLSKQYVLRFRPAPGDPAEPRVLVRLHGDLSRWGESAKAATLVSFPGSSARCPELAALTLEGAVLRSADCGRRFTRWRPGGVDTAQQLVPGPHGAIFLLTGGRVVRVSADGTITPSDTGLAVNERLTAGWDGTTWAVGTDAAGAPGVARRTGGDERFQPFLLAGLPPGPLALLPAGAGETACVLVGNGQRLCGDGLGPSRLLAVDGLPGGPWTGGGEIVSLSERSGTFLWATPGGAVLRTLDGGGHFRETLPAVDGRWRLTAVPTSRPMACAASSRSVRCSEDAGFSWFPVGTDLDSAATSVALTSAAGQVFVDRGQRMDRLAWVVNRDIPSSSVYFETGSDVPGPAILPFLKKLGRTLAEKPELLMRVEGHADRRGGDALNDELARRRAQRVAEAVIAAGARPEQVEAASFGSRRPLRPGAEQDLARNRRVELLLMEPMAVESGPDHACPAETSPPPPGEEPGEAPAVEAPPEEVPFDAQPGWQPDAEVEDVEIEE
jgi:outer membrane protein OmpA-like peptidoglycan-associated protein